VFGGFEGETAWRSARLSSGTVAPSVCGSPWHERQRFSRIVLISQGRSSAAIWLPPAPALPAAPAPPPAPACPQVPCGCPASTHPCSTATSAAVAGPSFFGGMGDLALLMRSIDTCALVLLGSPPEGATRSSYETSDIGAPSEGVAPWHEAQRDWSSVATSQGSPVTAPPPAPALPPAPAPPGVDRLSVLSPLEPQPPAVDESTAARPATSTAEERKRSEILFMPPSWIFHRRR